VNTAAMLPVGHDRDRHCDLTGTVALLTGGSRGVGRLLAARLAQAGAVVGLVARSADELAAAVEEIKRAGGMAAAPPRTSPTSARRPRPSRNCATGWGQRTCSSTTRALAARPGQCGMLTRRSGGTRSR
jgi:NAD(P)-dependent dehydrogenase (short-subunit alcohol dehydrogenase family)